MRRVIIILLLVDICQCFKLRRDIAKIRHYCKEICQRCEGQSTINLDVCICNIESAETAEVQKCLEKANNKLSYLGIEWKTEYSVKSKRSIFNSEHQPIKEEQQLTYYDLVNINGTPDRSQPRKRIKRDFDRQQKKNPLNRRFPNIFIGKAPNLREERFKTPGALNAEHASSYGEIDDHFNYGGYDKYNFYENQEYSDEWDDVYRSTDRLDFTKFLLNAPKAFRIYVSA